MSYKYEYTFDANKLIKKFSEFHNKSMQAIESSKDTINKEKLTRWDINFSNPNYSLKIGNLKTLAVNENFMAEKNYTISMSENTIVHNSYNSSAEEQEIIPIESWKRAIEPLGKKYLRKTSNSFSVEWRYSDEANINAPVDDDVLSYSLAKDIFLPLRNGICKRLYVNSSSGKYDICNVASMIYLLNRKDSLKITTSAKLIESNNCEFSGYNINNVNFTFSDISANSLRTNISTSTDSILTENFLKDNYQSNNLDDTISFNIDSCKSIDEKKEHDIITKEEIEEYYLSDLIKKTSILNRNFGALSSSYRGAATIKLCHDYISAKVSDFFTYSLQDFIKSGTSNSALSDLYSYLDSLINKLSSQYVKNNECRSLSPNNVNEGCFVSCENIELDEDTLMVTKQKLKAVVFCGLKC